MNRTNLRPAIAMIELIFAIVVMGIALMSAPMLISTAVSSSTVAMQQEGINEAASKVNMIMTYDWDENNVNVPCKGNPSILHTSSNTILDNENNTTMKRPGTPANSLGHTYNCNGEEYNATAFGSLGIDDNNETDDIDDFIGTSSLVTVNTGAGGVDYLEQGTVSIDTNLSYIEDNASYDSSTFIFTPKFTSLGKTTNIKSITVTLTSRNTADELAKTIILRAFSSNVGAYHYYTAKVK